MLEKARIILCYTLCRTVRYLVRGPWHCTGGWAYVGSCDGKIKWFNASKGYCAEADINNANVSLVFFCEVQCCTIQGSTLEMTMRLQVKGLPVRTPNGHFAGGTPPTGVYPIVLM